MSEKKYRSNVVATLLATYSDFEVQSLHRELLGLNYFQRNDPRARSEMENHIMQILTHPSSWEIDESENEQDFELGSNYGREMGWYSGDFGDSYADY